MRVAPALLVTVALASACDSGGPDKPRVPSGPGAITAVRALGDTTLNVDGGPVALALAGRFRHNKGLAVRFDVTSQGAAAAVRLSGDTLRLVPALHGTTAVRLQAITDDGTALEAPFRVTVEVPARVDVVRTPADTTVYAGRADLRVLLPALFRHRDGRSLTYQVAVPAGPPVAVGRSGDTLVVSGQQDGAARLTVEAVDRGRTTTTSFRVTSVRSWCPEPPAGYADFFPAETGQALRFRYADSYGPSGAKTTQDGTLTWRITSAACDAGTRTVQVDELLEGTRTGPQSPPIVTEIRGVRSFTFSVVGASLYLGPYGPTIFSQQLTPFTPYGPADGRAEVTFRYGPMMGAGCSGSETITLSRPRGLLRLSKSTSCLGGSGAYSLERLPD